MEFFVVESGGDGVHVRGGIYNFGYLLNDVKCFDEVCARRLFAAFYGLSKPFWFLSMVTSFW
jgi:hypothetical protein